MWCLTLNILALPTLLALFRVAAGQNCEIGNFRSGGRCIPCRPGTFRNDIRTSVCTPCRAGTYSPLSGAVSSENCINCAAGFFSLPGSRSCRRCPKGKVSNVGFSKCYSCPRNKVLSEIERDGCTSCEPGFFAGENKRACERCPSGTFSTSAATSCSLCPKGTYREINRRIAFIDRRCFKCPDATFADKKGTIQCKLCPLGSIAAAGSRGCRSCPAGKYRGRLRAPSCRSCPPGSSSKGKNPAGCKHPQKGCPTNTFEDANGECRACLPGERVDMTKRVCVKCGGRQISSGGNTQKCMGCPPGKRPADNKSIYEKYYCECNPGSITTEGGECKPCPAGYYWEQLARDTPAGFTYTRVSFRQESRCLPCDGGFFSKTPGALECKACPPGSTSGAASTKCDKCPRAHITLPKNPSQEFQLRSMGTEGCYSLKHNCQQGQIRAKSDGRCVWGPTCPPFLYRAPGGFCTLCPPNNFFNRKSNSCSNCMKPRFFNLFSNLSPTCRSCPIGQTPDSVGDCVCDFGYERVRGACRRCLSNAAPNQRKCPPCPERSIPEIFLGESICTECAPRTYKARPNDTTCTKCPPGFKSRTDVLDEPVNGCVSQDGFRTIS